MVCDGGKFLMRRRKTHGTQKINELLYENRMQFSGGFNWAGEFDSTLVAETLTQDGYCQSYNVIDANYVFRNDTVDPKFINEYQKTKDYNFAPVFWSASSGYNLNNRNYPFRAFDGKSTKFTTSPEIPLKKVKKIDNFCRPKQIYTRILLSHPAEVPDGTNEYLVIPINKSAIISLKPNIIKTADSLKAYDPSVQEISK